jgi:DNA-binding transcriptional regulator PaaX
MPKRTDISPVIDGLLRVAVLGGAGFVLLAAPNAIQALDGPLRKFLDAMDEKARKRELKKLQSYMKRTGLITEDYKHGITITKKARERLEKINIESLEIDTMPAWDHKWRVVFYDIPEIKKSGRDALTAKLRELGCYQLQRSVWVHPFPCENVITAVASAYSIEKYITYLETTHISNESTLIKSFTRLNLC